MDARFQPRVGQQLSEQGYTQPEAEAIIRRAVELQQQADSGAGPVPHATLEASAGAVGIRPEFVQQAAEEVRAREAAAARQAGVRRRSRAQLVTMGVAFVIAALISLLLSFRVAVQHKVRVAPPPAVVQPQGAPRSMEQPPIREAPPRR